MSVIEKAKNIIEKYIPENIIEIFERLLVKKEYIKKNNIKKYFISLDKENQEPEIVEIINYFEKHRFSVFPYIYQKNYHAKDVVVYYDKAAKMLYVVHNNRKLFFPYSDKEKVKRYYNLLRKEQDKNSPHRYEANDFIVSDGDIIADIGAAEGIWALENVEKANKIFLFECDEKWVKCLEKTFYPWKEKVVVINKYISDSNYGEYTTLDAFFKDKRIDFIKADIEGMEINLLTGSKELLKRDINIKMLLCTYHRQNDAKIFKKIFEENGFTTEYSKGYLLFIHDEELEEPYVRRGLIRAKKEIGSIL